MNFVSLVCDSGKGSGTGEGTLPCSVRCNEALVYDPPKRSDSLGFGVKKILKKSSSVNRLRIGVRFPVLASFHDPIVRFRGVNNLKEARGIEIRAALIIQNPVIVGLDSNHDVRQTRGEVGVSRVFATELNNHREGELPKHQMIGNCGRHSSVSLLGQGYLKCEGEKSLSLRRVAASPKARQLLAH